jgi:large subunit ribosomal protein L32
MAVPKKRTSSSARGMRRSHDALAVPTHLVACPSCGEPRPRHQPCPHCGRYRGRQVLPPRKD